MKESDTVTPKVRRAVERDEASRQLPRWLADTNTDQVELADNLGIHESLVARMASRKCDNTMTIVDVRMSPRELARRALQWIAEPHGLLVSEAPGQSPEVADDLGHLAQMIDRCGVTASTFSASLADGVIDVDEAEQIHRAACAAIETMLGVANRAKQVLEKRGDKVRRIRPAAVKGAAG